MRCLRYLFVFALGSSILAAASAQPPIEPRDGKYIVPLSIQPAGPPAPALKYRLLPELREMQSGNQIQAFYKCFFEQQNTFFSKEATDKQQKWMAAPLQELKGDMELRGYGGVALKQAHYAARLDTVDWQITNQAKSDGVMLLLPDIQQLRALAALLKVRVRGEIARGEFDAAIQTLQTMFALARTFNEHPTLIGHLVGAAITMIALSEVEEFIAQPGAPNLFWALIDLPAPFIDLRKGREGEKFFLSDEYDVLRKATPIAEADLKKLIAKLDVLVDLADAKKELRPSVYYPAQAADPEAVKAARARLAMFGHKSEDIAKLSALQVALMDDLAQYQVDLDDFLKWTNVPNWQAPADLSLKMPRRSPFGQVLPAYMKVMLAKLRLQQHFALLINAEGVRAHAGVNGGKLPASLNDVKLPLPLDPVTGKPFVYEFKDGTAKIIGTPPAGREKEPSFNRVYEITIRK